MSAGRPTLLLTTLLLASSAIAHAQASPSAAPAARADSVLEQRTREVASQLRCPICQGVSIADSPADLAVQMKALVREQLRAGRSPEEVRQYFIGRYGEWILLEPKPTGANLLVYLIPVAVVAGGLILVWRVVRKWTAQATAPSDAPPPGAD